MTATMEAPAPAPTSPEAGVVEDINVQAQLAESGLDEYSAQMLAGHIDDLKAIMDLDEAARTAQLGEIENLISDIALQIEGKVYDETEEKEQGIHQSLNEEQRAIVQTAVIENIGENGLDWLNDKVAEENFTGEEKATLQELFSRDATEAYGASVSAAVANENEPTSRGEGNEQLAFNLRTQAEEEQERDDTVAGHAQVLFESGRNNEGEPSLSEAGARMIAEHIETINSEDDIDALVESIHNLTTTVRFIEQYTGQRISDEVREATMHMLETVLGDKLESVNERINNDLDEIDPSRAEAREENERQRALAELEAKSIDHILNLAAQIHKSRENGDSRAIDSMQEGIAALILIYSAQYGWDDARRQSIIEQVQAIERGDAEPVSARPEEEPSVSDSIEAGSEDEAITSPRRFRDRFASFKLALSAAVRGDIPTATEQVRYAFGRSGERSPEARGWSRRKKILAFAAGAAAIYGLHRYGVIDVNPFDGDGIDLNPFNNGDKPPSGDGGGAAEHINSAPEVQADLPGYSEVVNHGDTTGATYVMDGMFNSGGNHLTPEQLHDLYLTAVQEKGSQGFADLMTGNVVALPNPVDKWGTVTQINTGDVGFTGFGRKYLEELARAKGYIG